MLTYLNGYGQRTEVTNTEDIAKWHEINIIVKNMDDTLFSEMIEIVGNYVWEGGRSNANKIRGFAKRNNLNWRDLELWYLLED